VAAGIVDFRRLSQYSVQPEAVFHAGRRVVIGDAGAFPDPMFSPGIDQIGQICLGLDALLTRQKQGVPLTSIRPRLNAVILAHNLTAMHLPPAASLPEAFEGKLALRLIWEVLGSWALLAPQRFFPGYMSAVADGGVPEVLQRGSSYLHGVRQWIDNSELDALPLLEGERLDLHDIPGVADFYMRSLRPVRDLADLNQRVDGNLAFLATIEAAIKGLTVRMPGSNPLAQWFVGADCGNGPKVDRPTSP